jgi:alpha-ketoglutarate-dependent taurine dioxygenase
MQPSSLLVSADGNAPAGTPPTVVAEVSDDAPGWAAQHPEVRALAAQHGSVLIRGLGLHDAPGFGAIACQLGGTPATEVEAFAPRQPCGASVYSSTPWPENQPMCMHHELSYAMEFPGLMMFACIAKPQIGGAIGVADASAVLSALPAMLVDRFEREGWLLTRSYNDEIGATIAESFGSDDPSDVERYCQVNAIDYEWQPDGGLRTAQRRPAVVQHPLTGHRCWFNQIAFLSEWTMAAEVRMFLVDEYGADGLPFNTRFGNGDPIDADVVALINDVYEANTVHVAWEPGDLLLVDNVRSAHGRDPFEGYREVLVALTDPVHLTDCSRPAGEVPQ